MRLNVGDVGEYVGEVGPRERSCQGEVAYGDVPSGEVATPNGDAGTYGDVGEYAFGELGLYPGAAGDMPPAPRGLWKGKYGRAFDSSTPLEASGEKAAVSPLKDGS